MGKTKKQHYVPQFLLRRFSVKLNKKPKLWTLDKMTKAVRLSSTRDVAHENYFYEYNDDNGTSLKLEDLMAKIDSTGGGIIKRIIDKETLQLLPDDRVWLSYFVACQILRVPMIRKDMENLRSMIIHKWGPEVSAEGDERTIGDYGLDDDKLSSLKMIQDAPEFAKLLQTKVWILNRAPKNCSFIIGDNPVTRHNMTDRGLRGNLGIDNKGIELFMPLSPTYCIHIICPFLAELACCNQHLAENYIDAIKNGTPVDMQPENVEFVNSLQVIWSERFVFAQNRSEMEMPLNMLRTNPEFSNGGGVRQRPEDA